MQIIYIYKTKNFTIHDHTCPYSFLSKLLHTHIHTHTHITHWHSDIIQVLCCRQIINLLWWYIVEFRLTIIFWITNNLKVLLTFYILNSQLNCRYIKNWHPTQFHTDLKLCHLKCLWIFTITDLKYYKCTIS